MFLNTKALILREVKFKEADKMLTILSEAEGKLSVRARGALRKGSKIQAGTQLFCFSDMALFGNRGRWSLNEAVAIEQFTGLRSDISRLALAAYIAQVLEVVSDEDRPDVKVLSLGLNSFFALSRGLYPPEHIKAVFELRMMSLSGYAPAIECCGSCGAVGMEGPRLDLEGGRVYCEKCRIGGYGRPAGLCGDSLAAMGHVLDSEPKRIFSFELKGEARARFAKVCEDYLLVQLDRGFDTLDYWKTVRQAPSAG